jgi:uncharacterized protein
MTISHDEARGRFTVATDHGDAVVEYRLEGDSIDFTHTYVPPAARGRGVAEALVRHALDWAEQRQLKTEASCWYVARWLEFRRRGSRAH